MWWEDLLFLHWPYDPDRIAALLPPDLTPDVWADEAGNEACWVGLIPFRMRVGLPGGLPMPARLGVFPETNVRTYVRGPDGTPGVWFCSLEAGGLPAVATARLAYGLPYYWAHMTISGDARDEGDTWRYASRRRWPGPDVGRDRAAHHRSAATIGPPIADADVTPFEHYLTARWGLFSTFVGRTLYAPISHDPWPLQRATLLDLDDGLIAAAGLPDPVGAPVAHWTRGTEVRIGRPRLVRG